ncbi:hypothetical protein C8F04DRAFT_1267429 [Mycena alexandri]|uniref:Uncharacterized protein n=1 Tax=Mycena alexandri TaxID=1745969 RepID=A0AAD6SJ15_9AGAR|nr:hypothetical protein C8F04DRAFT_1267429 [Mycena alexandri]
MPVAGANGDGAGRAYGRPGAPSVWIPLLLSCCGHRRSTCTCFGWYAIKTVNNFRRDSRLKELLKGQGSDAEAAARVLVGYTLKEGGGEGGGGAGEEDGDEGWEGEGKKGVKRNASAMQEDDDGEGKGRTGRARDKGQGQQRGGNAG